MRDSGAQGLRSAGVGSDVLGPQQKVARGVRGSVGGEEFFFFILLFDFKF